MRKVSISLLKIEYKNNFCFYRDGAPRHALLSALGRLHLQLGDITGAEVCFNEAAETKGGVPGVRELVDRGLLSVAQSQFDEAYLLFQKASVLEPSNIMVIFITLKYNCNCMWYFNM